MLKLHLGCGKRFLTSYTHIDLADFAHVDYYQRIEDLSNFADGSVDEIYAIHCLEHFNRHEVPKVLSEWLPILKRRNIEDDGGGFSLLYRTLKRRLHTTVRTMT